jgi:type IX secretion system PorP/SprF family membrane protein
MKIIKIAIALIGVTMAGSALAQQQPMYSQYMFNMMNINPAYTGIRETPNATLLIRSQWTSFAGAPKTGNFTYDNGVGKKNHSWGGQMYYDKIGIESTTGVQGFYSYMAPFENATLSLGMSFGVMNYNIDYKDTNPFDPGDPGLTYAVNRFLPTAGAGALLSGKRWWVGLSAPALFKTKVTSNEQASVEGAGAEGHYFLSAGYVFPVSETVVLKPSTLLKGTSGAPLQADFNLNAWFNDMIGVGASYRTGSAVVGMFEYKHKEKFRFGYAYEYNTSYLNNYSGGTHELMLRYDLPARQETKRELAPKYF